MNYFKISFLFSAFITVLIVALVVTGCNKKSDNDSNGSQQSTYDASDSDGQIRKITYDAGQIETYSFDAMPQFLEEKLISADDLAGVRSNMVLTGDTLILYCRTEDKSGFIYFNEHGKKIRELPFNIDGYFFLFTVNKEGIIYLLTHEAAKKSASGEIKEVNRKLTVIKPEGTVLQSNNLGRFKSIHGTGTFPADMAVDAQGNVYLAIEDTIEIITPSGDLIKRDYDVYIDAIEIDAGNSIIRATSSSKYGEDPRLEKLSLETGEVIWNVKIPYRLKNMKLIEQHGGIYILTENGIQIVNPEGKILGYVFHPRGQIIHLPDYSYSDMEVDQYGRFYFMVGKNRRSNEAPETAVYRYSRYLKTQSRKISLTVSHLFTGMEDHRIDSLLSTFQRDNKDVSISINRILDWQTTEESERNLIKLNTEIMSGVGPDIINLRGLCARHYEDKKILADLNLLMHEDKDFSITDYLENIVKAFSKQDRQYLLPIQFWTTIVTANRRILEETGITIDDESWTWTDFFEICRKATRDLDGDGTFDQFGIPKQQRGDFFLARLLHDVSIHYIDYTAKTSNFLDPSFIKLLEKSKEYLDFNDRVNWITYENYYKDGPNRILFSFHRLSYSNLSYISGISDDELIFLRPPALESRYIKIYPHNLFAINSRSKYKMEAWAVLKFLLKELPGSDEKTGPFSSYMPIEKKIFYNIQRNMMNILDEKNYIKRGQGPQIILEPLSESQLQYINRIVQLPAYAAMNDDQLRKILSEWIFSFYRGEITAKQAAENIQNRIELYIGE